MIEIKHLSKTFQMKDGAVNALKDINLTIPDGSIYGIIGMSGAGKSTLVRCINLLERPTEGSVVIDGVEMEKLTPAQLRQRRREITMIFQQFNLLMQRSCLKNICFPMELAGVKKEEAEKRAKELLEMVGLPDKANAYPAQLSGGQKQRIAIARALATDPKVLLCDEATSALDPNTTHAILTLIKDINKKLGITVVVITHQMSVVEEICDHVAILDGGVVVEQGEVKEIFANPKTAAAKRLVAPNGGSAALPNWRLNLRFAAAWEEAMESRFPGLTRPVLCGYRFYNQDLTTGSLLIEIGGHGNTLEEALRAGEFAALALAELLGGQQP